MRSAIRRVLTRGEVRGWRSRHPSSLTILAYHRVNERFDPRRHLRSNWSSAADFERVLRRLPDHFRVVPLADGIAALERDELDGHSLALTFDDGALSLEHTIVPTLGELDLPATFFVTGGYLAGDPVHFSVVLRYLRHSPDPTVRALLTKDMADALKELRFTQDPQRYDALRAPIEALSARVVDDTDLFVDRAFLAGLDPRLFHVGLHGYEHQRFSMMTAAQQGEALDRDLAALETLPGFRRLFAVPFGSQRDWNADTIAVADERDLDVFLCAGGVNLGRRQIYDRICADGRTLTWLLRASISASGA